MNVRYYHVMKLTCVEISISTSKYIYILVTHAAHADALKPADLGAHVICHAIISANEKQYDLGFCRWLVARKARMQNEFRGNA